MLEALTPSEFYMRQFFRPPAWRAERSFSIIKRQAARVRMSDEDPLVLETVKYLRAENNLREQGRQEFERGRRLMARWPDIYGAYELHGHAGTTTPRTSLEAHLLAGAPHSKIAARLQVPETVVRAYAKLFYDVADRLDSVEYIAGFVIGPVFQSGLEAFNTELLTKYFSYFGGELMLDSILFGLTRTTGMNSVGEVVGYLEQSVNRNVKQQAATAMLLMQPSKFDVRTLIEGYTAIVALEHKLSEGQEEQGWLAGLIEVLRQVCPMPYTVEQRAQHAIRINSVSSDLPLEPRLEQRLALAAKKMDPKELSAKLLQFKLPEPGSDFNTASEAPR